MTPTVSAGPVVPDAGDMVAAEQAGIRFGQEVTGELTHAEQIEWLVTNGIGGYGSGTVAGSITRGYHGLLVAALRPPIDRRLMCVKVDETLTCRGAAFELATNRWTSGAVAPAGCTNIQSFTLEGSVPLWRYACADVLLDKRVWMKDGANTTYVAYTVVAAPEPVDLELRVIADNRVFHNTGQVAWPAQVTEVPGGVRVVSGASDAAPLTVLASDGSITATAKLYEGYQLPAEAARGLNDRDDHVHVATVVCSLTPGATVVLLASAEPDPAIDPDALDQRRARDRQIIADWRGAQPGAAKPPAWGARLALAADQFVVRRGGAASPATAAGHSIIAGYHWFEDWGRDTMISLPGLTLATGRPEVAASILRSFAQYVSDGMLPNRFPDGSAEPVYNTIDATLWYFQSIRAHADATGDTELLSELWPVLKDIIDWHRKGTRYSIKVDPADGLLAGGEPGVQLTWMDAIVDGRVITPRIGKPVEVNALWYNALRAMQRFAAALSLPGDEYARLADTAAQGFERFWNPGTGYCYDVLDGPDGGDPTLRPNQLLAVSLPEPLLDTDRRHAIVDVCARHLLTSRGLRSLTPEDPAFVGFYPGDQAHRDGAYHQGTVWGWLIGPFVDAVLRVHGDTAAASRLLDPFADHLAAAGLGTVSEVFDGAAPFAPQGCIAQAWSVGELLRVSAALSAHFDAAGPAASGSSPVPGDPSIQEVRP